MTMEHFGSQEVYALVHGQDVDVPVVECMTEDDTADPTCHKSSKYIHHQK